MNTKYTTQEKLSGVTRRFHIDINDDIEKIPNANYWKMAALGAFKKLGKLAGCNDENHAQHGCKVISIMGGVWNKDNTWMEICLKTEHARDLFIKLRAADTR